MNIQRISFSASLITHNVNQDKFFLIYLLIDLFLSSQCYLLFYARLLNFFLELITGSIEDHYNLFLLLCLVLFRLFVGVVRKNVI